MQEQGSAQSKTRQPVVAIVGHVDHGKTTLLDYIRKTNLAAREAGGITQAVGAYEIEHRTANTEPVKRITFIDTPGHEAFIKMRARGAEAADLAILVVAADESIKPQTKESIKILKETKTPFIVAINKIDKPGVDIDKVKNDLTAANVLLEGYGGQVSYQPISAKTGEGVNELLDLILLTAEVEHLTYDPTASVRAIVLESRRTKERGIEVTLIVKEGVLKRGTELHTASADGKVKILENFLGKAVIEVSAGAPALVIGFETIPNAGEGATEEKQASKPAVATQTSIPAAHAEKNGKTLNLILKASDAGSLEALTEIVRAMHASHPVKIVAESVGDIIENDVKLAISVKGVVIGFKTKVEKSAQSLAEVQRVELITSPIIYELLKAIDEFLMRLAKPLATGELQVLAVFNQKKLDKQIVGGRVTRGVFKNKSAIEVMRAGAVVAKGKLGHLEQDKKDVTQVLEGKEAGLMVNVPEAIQVGDILLCREE